MKGFVWGLVLKQRHKVTREMPHSVSKVVGELLWFFYGLRQPRSNGLLSSRPPGAIEDTLGTKSWSSLIIIFVPRSHSVGPCLSTWYITVNRDLKQWRRRPQVQCLAKSELIFYLRNTLLSRFHQWKLFAEFVQAKYENTKNYPPLFAVSKIRRAIAAVVCLSSLVATDLKP